MAPDKIVIETVPSSSLRGWLDARLSEFNAVLARRPMSALIVTGPVMAWKHELLIRYGRMLGAIEIMATQGFIQPREAKELNAVLKGATHATIADLVSGRM